MPDNIKITMGAESNELSTAYDLGKDGLYETAKFRFPTVGLIISDDSKVNLSFNVFISGLPENSINNE